MAPTEVCPSVTICLIVVMLCLLHVDSALTKNPEHNADVLETTEDEFGYLYGLPGVQFEYRFEVGAGKSQCFYEKLQQGAQLNMVFEVRTHQLLKFT